MHSTVVCFYRIHLHIDQNFREMCCTVWRFHFSVNNNFDRSVSYPFFNMGQPRPLLFIFHCKAIYNNDLQTGHSVGTFMHLWQVVFAFWAYLSSREAILGRCHRGLLALQDGEVTIITQTVEDTMFLSKLRRFIRVIWFTLLKVSIEQKQKSSY